jgi:hypothetical protein
MVMAFRATYFDRTIMELPPPLAYDISTNQVHRLFSETSGARGFQPVQFEAISYFESADERMLRLAEGDKLTAAAQLNDFLVGCNQKNEIGCFAPGYARQVRESLLN